MDRQSQAEAIRKRRGLTVIELAAKTGLARQTIYSIERKPEHRPSADVAIKIARALDVSVEELLEPACVA